MTDTSKSLLEISGIVIGGGMRNGEVAESWEEVACGG